MTHSRHENEPGYSPAQILHDGCGECGDRAASRTLGIASLDQHSFAAAWARAAEWNRDGLDDISDAEAAALSVLWAVQCQLEDRGFPIGQVPSADWAQLLAGVAR